MTQNKTTARYPSRREHRTQTRHGEKRVEGRKGRGIVRGSGSRDPAGSKHQ